MSKLAIWTIQILSANSKCSILESLLITTASVTLTCKNIPNGTKEFVELKSKEAL